MPVCRRERTALLSRRSTAVVVGGILAGHRSSSSCLGRHKRNRSIRKLRTTSPDPPPFPSFLGSVSSASAVAVWSNGRSRACPRPRFRSLHDAAVRAAWLLITTLQKCDAVFVAGERLFRDRSGRPPTRGRSAPTPQTSSNVRLSRGITHAAPRRMRSIHGFSRSGRSGIDVRADPADDRRAAPESPRRRRADTWSGWRTTSLAVPVQS